jgi:hypothetical protein
MSFFIWFPLDTDSQKYITADAHWFDELPQFIKRGIVAFSAGYINPN